MVGPEPRKIAGFAHYSDAQAHEDRAQPAIMTGFSAMDQA
jgi:hypothetical protein